VATLLEHLHQNAYPGRGIVWSRLPNGSWCAAYLLTGRSEASRRREIRLGEHGDLEVVPTDAVQEDDLRHYAAAVETDTWLVCGNGRQVATVRDRLVGGAPPVDALQDLEYEPDPPILTARITAIVRRTDPSRAWFGVARRPLSQRTAGVVVTMTVRDLAPGDAVLVTTYRSDGTTVDPAEVYLEGSTDAANPAELTDQLWAALAPERRVAVAAFGPGGLREAVIRD
jgi:IMP cyclohydrolase